VIGRCGLAKVFDFGIELLTCPVNRETIAAIEAWPA
jgi:hypothetical protein